MNQDAFDKLRKENSYLFWWVKEEDKVNLPLESWVEAVLNYGNIDSVKLLLSVDGIDSIAKIFYRQISGKRVNYFPQTINYFSLYFKKYASGNFS